MAFVTLTDHNTLDGAMEIAHHPDAFASVEVTTRFPEDREPLHVLVWDLDEAVWADLDRLRPNVYELVEYLRVHGLAHALAHPLHRVGASLTQSHIERFLLLFGVWEGRNGARPAEGNEAAVRIAGSASREYLEKLADKHGIAPAGSGPPGLVAGSDDHGLFDVAATWTETPPAADVDALLGHVVERRATVAGAHGSTDALAHSVGTLAMRAAIERGVATLPPALHGVVAGLIDQSLPEPPAGAGGEGGAVGALVMTRLRRDRAFRRGIRRLGREHQGAERDHRRLRTTSEWLHRTLRGAAADGAPDRSLRALGRRAEHATGALAVAAPYLLAAGYHRGEARFALEAEGGFLGAPVLETPAPRVAMLTDTLDEANGVAGTMRRLADHAAARGDDRMTVVACGDREVDQPGLRRFAAAGRMTLPIYGDRAWRLGIPSIIELLRFAEERRIDVFHAATPGPMGLTGLLLARTLGRPFVATYHTEIQRYVLELTQDRLAALVAGGAIGWFYRQAERVYVPSASSGASVVGSGVDPARVARFSRGVDTARFSPERRTPRARRRLAASDEAIVLYVGRLSREKGVLDLARAFRLAAERRPELRLVVVGEGPARVELAAALAGTRHRFEGELRGDALATAYACSDVFCMPSTTETFGQVIAEAAASGLPAVVVDRGAAPELVTDGVTGLVAPPDAPGELAARIERLAADPALRRQMGDAARRSVAARPGWAAVFDDLIAGYAELESDAAPIAASPVAAERPGVVA